MDLDLDLDLELLFILGNWNKEAPRIDNDSNVVKHSPLLTISPPTFRINGSIDSANFEFSWRCIGINAGVTLASLPEEKSWRTRNYGHVLQEME